MLQILAAICSAQYHLVRRHQAVTLPAFERCSPPLSCLLRVTREMCDPANMGAKQLVII